MRCHPSTVVHRPFLKSRRGANHDAKKSKRSQRAGCHRHDRGSGSSCRVADSFGHEEPSNSTEIPMQEQPEADWPCTDELPRCSQNTANRLGGFGDQRSVIGFRLELSDPAILRSGSVVQEDSTQTGSLQTVRVRTRLRYRPFCRPCAAPPTPALVRQSPAGSR